MATVAERSLQNLTRTNVEWTTTASSVEKNYTTTVLFNSGDNILVTINDALQTLGTDYVLAFLEDSPTTVRVSLTNFPANGATIRVYIEPDDFGLKIDNTGPNNPTKIQQQNWALARNDARLAKSITDHTAGDNHETTEQIIQGIEEQAGDARLDYNSLKNRFQVEGTPVRVGAHFYSQKVVFTRPTSLNGTITLPTTGSNADGPTGLYLPFMPLTAGTGPILTGGDNYFEVDPEGFINFTSSAGGVMRFTMEVEHQYPGTSVPSHTSRVSWSNDVIIGSNKIALSEIRSATVVPNGSPPNLVASIRMGVWVKLFTNASKTIRQQTNLSAFEYERAGVWFHQANPQYVIRQMPGATAAEATAIAANTAKVGIPSGYAAGQILEGGIGDFNWKNKITQWNGTTAGVTLFAGDIISRQTSGGVDQRKHYIVNAAIAGTTAWNDNFPTNGTLRRIDRPTDGEITPADGSVNTIQLADDAVTAQKVKKGNTLTGTGEGNADLNVADDSIGIPQLDIKGTSSVDDVIIINNDGNLEWATPSAGSVTSDPTLQGEGTPSSSLGVASTVLSAIAANTAKVGVTDGGIDTEQLADNAVTVDKIDGTPAVGQVYRATSTTRATWQDLPATGATNAQAAAIALNTAKVGLTDRSVTTARIVDGAVTTAKIADRAVSTAKIADRAVGTGQIVNNSVGATQLSSTSSDTFDVARAVTTNHIRNNAVTTAKIANDAVTGAKIANNSITPEHIDGTPTAGQVYTATSATRATWQTPASGGGDTTLLGQSLPALPA